MEVTAANALNEATQAKAAEFRILELSSQKYAVEMAMERRSYVIRAEIANETNGDGKKVFSNADMRKGEEMARAETDEQLQELRKQLTDINREIGEYQVEGKYHARNVRILCAFASRENGDDNAWEE